MDEDRIKNLEDKLEELSKKENKLESLLNDKAYKFETLNDEKDDKIRTLETLLMQKESKSVSAKIKEDVEFFKSIILNIEVDSDYNVSVYKPMVLIKNIHKTGSINIQYNGGSSSVSLSSGKTMYLSQSGTYTFNLSSSDVFSQPV